MVTLSSPASATIPITDALSQYEEAWHATWPLAELEPRSWTTSWHYLLSASKMSTIPPPNKKASRWNYTAGQRVSCPSRPRVVLPECLARRLANADRRSGCEYLFGRAPRYVMRTTVCDKTSKTSSDAHARSCRCRELQARSRSTNLRLGILSAKAARSEPLCCIWPAKVRGAAKLG